MTVYIDIILAENLCMNYIILYATGVIYKLKPKVIRLVLASLIGAAYAILSYMQILEIYSSLVLKILLSIGMVYLAFNPKNIKILAKQLLIFYLTSFVFGGVAFALLYFVKPQDILMKNGIYTGTYPLKIVFLGAIIGFIILTSVFKTVKGKLTRKELFCKVIIRIDKKETEVTAMVDTGNLLREPITGASVIVVEKFSLKKILPEQVLDNLNSILNGDYTDDLGEYAAKFRVIPFSSLGKPNGMLLGIKPDEIIIEAEEDEIKVPNAIVGIYNDSLTKNGLYTALIGLEILERREKNESIRIAERQH